MLADVVDAEEGRAPLEGEDCHGDAGGDGPRERVRVAEKAPEEALAGGADEHRPPERHELVEPGQQLDVLLDGLAEADAGIQADVLLRNPRLDREGQALLQEGLDLGDDVVVARVVLHRPRLAEHVQQTEVRAGLGDDSGQVRVTAERGHVVHHHCAQLERPPGHGGL